MVTVTSSVVVGAGPAEVVAVLLDPDSAPEWTSGLERLEVVSGSAGGVGSVAHAHYREGSRKYVLVDRLVEVDPDRRYVSYLSGSGLAARVETVIEPIEQGVTRLDLVWEGHGTNPLTALVLPLLRRRIGRRAANDLGLLRNLVERRRAG